MYKVVREDYGSIHDGSFSYKGKYPKTFTHPRPDRSSAVCGVGLHACHKAEDTLQFASGVWPLRLLEVEGQDELGRDETKARFAALTVRRELPLGRAFGPNGVEVVRFIESLATIRWFKPEKAPRKDVVERRISAHLSALKKFGCPQKFEVEFTEDWDAARGAAQGAAWDAAWDAAWGAAWGAAWDAARDAARGAAWGAAWGAARDAARDAAWDAARDAARDAAWDAAWDAAHIVSKDLLDFPNPFEPLMDLYRMGLWPAALTKEGKFIVLAPKIK